MHHRKFIPKWRTSGEKGHQIFGFIRVRAFDCQGNSVAVLNIDTPYHF
jgi:hypothetical protein